MANIFKHRSIIISCLSRRVQNCHKTNFSFIHNATQKLLCEKLTNRDIIRISGKDTVSLLQGLITNDMHHFDDANQSHSPCMYSLMLNLQGRILYDFILYKSNKNNDEFLLECDKSMSDSLIKHVKKYKLRKKVDIISVGEQFNLWSVFKEFDPDTSVEQSSQLKLENDNNVVVSVPDPRLLPLGHRLILKGNTPIDSVVADIDVSCSIDNSKYTSLRYQLGVGEGVKDLPPDNCYPLDSNGDLLHGISFNKGCYLGQELTSRTYHTGVIRKRLMPITIMDPTFYTKEIPGSAVVVNEDGKNMGRYRNHHGKYGLAMLKIKESLNSKKLLIKDFGLNITIKVPFWWPPEALKEAAH